MKFHPSVRYELPRETTCTGCALRYIAEDGHDCKNESETNEQTEMSNSETQHTIDQG